MGGYLVTYDDFIKFFKIWCNKTSAFFHQDCKMLTLLSLCYSDFVVFKFIRLTGLVIPFRSDDEKQYLKRALSASDISFYEVVKSA